MTVSFATETLTVIDPVYVTERGDEVATYPAGAPEREVEGVRVQPVTGEEVHFSGAADEGGTTRDAVVDRRKVFAPYDVDVTPFNRVRFEGLVFEVDGPVNRWKSATGRLAHVEFFLRRVTG